MSFHESLAEAEAAIKRAESALRWAEKGEDAGRLGPVCRELLKAVRALRQAVEAGQ